MEHLTKSQIVLLTLFVSFVASMATGIVVVTLMQQASEPISQTITNVVERTIEKITPGPTEKVTKTVVVKDEDLLVSAIDRNIKSIVALRTVGEDGSILSSGVGVVVSSDGLMITDRDNFGVADRYATINGVQYSVEIISNDSENVLGLGRLVAASSTLAQALASSVLGDTTTLKLGQTAIVIGGRDGKTITTGFISNLDTHVEVNKDTKKETNILDGIGISVRFAGTSNGAPIINLNGEVIGFLSIDESTGSQVGVPAIEASRLIEGMNKPVVEKKI